MKVKDSFSGAGFLLLLRILRVLGLSDLMANAFTSEPSLESHNKFWDLFVCLVGLQTVLKMELTL